MLKTVFYALAVISLAVAPALRSDKKVIYPPGSKPGGNWSPGIRMGDTLYISGMSGEDSSGRVPSDFETEMKQSLDHIDAVLKSAGMSSSDVVSVQVYLSDVELFQRMNALYTSYFKDPRPTRTTVVVAKLVGPGHVEITATARK